MIGVYRSAAAAISRISINSANPHSIQVTVDGAPDGRSGPLRFRPIVSLSPSFEGVPRPCQVPTQKRAAVSLRLLGDRFSVNVRDHDACRVRLNLADGDVCAVGERDQLASRWHLGQSYDAPAVRRVDVEADERGHSIPHGRQNGSVRKGRA